MYAGRRDSSLGVGSWKKKNGAFLPKIELY
jgi:hypothetical protein